LMESLIERDNSSTGVMFEIHFFDSDL